MLSQAGTSPASQPLDVWQLTSHMAEAAAEAHEDDAIRQTLILRLLDLVGCAAAGYQLGTHIPLAAALAEPGDIAPWFTGTPQSTSTALRSNVFISHAAYMEDGSRSTGGHPSSVVIPAALTYSAIVPGCRRHDILGAIAAGYEVFLRVGERAYPGVIQRGFQSSAVLAPMAVAAVIARLLNLSPHQTAHALALAAPLGAGLKATVRASRTQPLQLALSSDAGRVAALMAAQGALGHPNILTDGFYPAYAGGESLDQPWQHPRLLETYVKLHGGCRGNHAPLDAFLSLQREHGLTPADITQIRVMVDRHTLAAEIPVPTTPEQAQFSIAYVIAVAALYAETSCTAFSQQRLDDPSVIHFMRCIRVEHNPDLDDAFPLKRISEVSIRTRDAFVYNTRMEYPLGEPENPADLEHLLKKFDSLATPLLQEDTPLIRDAILGFGQDGTVDTLHTLLSRARP